LVEHAQLGVIGAASWYLGSGLLEQSTRRRRTRRGGRAAEPSGRCVRPTWCSTSRPSGPTRTGDGKHIMKHSKSALSAAILPGLAMSAGVHAQDARQQATELDTVVVTGIRGSMERSLDTKREADARLEVVTAEDVGKLPAHNVADTLQRLPGVNISSSSADAGGLD